MNTDLQEIRVEDTWWEGSTFCILDKDTNKVWRLEGAYVTNIHYNGLDYCDNEELTLVGSNKLYE